MIEEDGRPLLVRLHDPECFFSHEEFKSFVTHENPFVRAAAAGRADCPPQFQASYVNDSNPAVLAAAAGNIIATPEIFKRAFYFPKAGNEGEVFTWAPRHSACANPRLPREYAQQFRAFDPAELLAYINSGNALPEALAYAASFPKPDEGKPDNYKEIRTVAQKIIDRMAAEEKILARLRKDAARVGTTEVALQAELKLGQILGFALWSLIDRGAVSRKAGRLLLVEND